MHVLIFTFQKLHFPISSIICNPTTKVVLLKASRPFLPSITDVNIFHMQVVPIEKGKELIILENCNKKLCHYCNNSRTKSKAINCVFKMSAKPNDYSINSELNLTHLFMIHGEPLGPLHKMFINIAIISSKYRVESMI